ncbi:MAG: amino acid ABC transporter substrate-binding protein [Lachnospiraceae bacterium]|nr:amino acid ABC transporter substrate-binding protein [Lachnospiraceae bacterium]
MKKLKKLVSIVVASAMVLAMAGCGASDAGNTAGGDTFKIGGIGPTTGAAAIYGMAVQNAAQLAVEEINAAGGVNGYQLELNFQDDEHDAEKSVNAYNNLKDWGAQIILGSVTSAPCIAVVEKTKEDNMFQITPSGTAVECVQYDNAFRVCFSDPTQGVIAAQYIKEKALGTKIAIIYDSSDTYSTGIYEAFAGEAANQSLEIVSTEAFTADSNKDFSVQLQKAKDAGADLVFLPIYYSESALILSQAAQMAYAPTFFSVDGMDGILSVDNFDASLAEGSIFLSPFTSTVNAKAETFSAAYEAKFGEIPNQFAADSYDAVYIIKQALEAKNATPDMTVSDLCEALKSAMVEINFSGTTGDSITWSADGEPTKAPIAIKIVNGEYTVL